MVTVNKGNHNFRNEHTLKVGSNDQIVSNPDCNL